MDRNGIMRRIVCLPGVGFHFSKHNNLIKSLEKSFPNAEIEYFDWKHGNIFPELSWKDSTYHNIIRRFSAEIMFDYNQAIKYAFQTMVPDADLYIGHSAGSILALAQFNKPCIIFGSPAVISENSWFNDKVNYIINSKVEQTGIVRPVYNIINKYDILSYPINFDNIENVTYKKHYWNPIAAHLDYWKNPDVIKMVENKIREWDVNILEKRIAVCIEKRKNNPN